MKAPSKHDLRRRAPRILTPEQAQVWKACIAKRGYRTELAAKLAAFMHGQRIYSCRFCGGFHLTSHAEAGA